MTKDDSDFIYGFIIWPNIKGSSNSFEPVNLDNVKPLIENQVRNTKLDAKQEFAFIKPNSSEVRLAFNSILLKQDNEEMKMLANKLHESTSSQSGVGFLVFLRHHRNFYVCRYPSDKQGLLPEQKSDGQWYIKNVENVFRRKNNYFKSTVFEIKSNGEIGTKGFAFDLQNRDFKVSDYWGQSFLEMMPTKSPEFLNKHYAIALRDAYNESKGDIKKELLQKIVTLQAIPRINEKSMNEHIVDLQLSEDAVDIIKRKIDLNTYGGAQFKLDYEIHKKVLGIQKHEFESGIELTVPDNVECEFSMEKNEETGKILTTFLDTLSRTRVTKTK